MPVGELPYLVLETSLQGRYYYPWETDLERQNDLPNILANEDNVQVRFSSFHSMQILTPPLS